MFPPFILRYNRYENFLSFGMIFPMTFNETFYLRALYFLPEFELCDPPLKDNHLFRPLDTNVSFRGSFIVGLRKMSLSRSLHIFYNTRPNPTFVCVYSILHTQLLLIYSPKETRSNIFLLASVLEEFVELKALSL